MNKLITLSTLILLIFSCAFWSCNNLSPEEKVAQKIENGEELTLDDYEVMYSFLIDHIKAIVESAEAEDVATVMELLQDEVKGDLLRTYEKEIGSDKMAFTIFMILNHIPLKPSDCYYDKIQASKGAEKIDNNVETAAWDTTINFVEETKEIVEAEPIDTEPDFKMSRETEMFVGNIGPYPIKMCLEYDDNHGADNTESYQINISGKYTYTRNGSTFELNGVESPVYGITLSEFTKSGNNTGDFDLQRNDEGDRLNGTFTNLTNGKQFTVKLKKVN